MEIVTTGNTDFSPNDSQGGNAGNDATTDIGFQLADIAIADVDDNQRVRLENFISRWAKYATICQKEVIKFYELYYVLQIKFCHI